MGSLDGNRLVFQQYEGRRSNIMIMNLATRRAHGVGKLNTRHWEYWPRMDGSRILFARQNLSTGKRALILTNTRTGTSRTLATAGARAYLLPGQVNGDYAVWGLFKEGKLAIVRRHRISTGNTVTVPNGGAYNWGPSVSREGTVFFGRSGRRCGTNTGFFRWSGGGATQTVDLPNGVDMASSFVHTTRDGKVQVFHDRHVCTQRYGVDLYRFIDPFTVTLTVTTSGNRTGTVTARGINCGAQCTQDFEPGTTVTLTATPEAGARFDTWSDPSCGSNTTCTITITADTTIDASFRP
jgi:hypothetical protein